MRPDLEAEFEGEGGEVCDHFDLVNLVVVRDGKDGEGNVLFNF